MQVRGAQVRTVQGGAAQVRTVQVRAGVLRRMDAEWAALQEDGSAAQACRRWAEGTAELAGCGSPADVLDRVAGAPDVVLGGLLAGAARGDRLAARVVLQALLPKVVRMASVDPRAEVDDYVAAMWCSVAAYPVARRPTSVAANLALDTLKAVHRQRHPAPDVVTSPEVVLQAADHPHAAVVGRTVDPAGPSVADVLDRARQHRLVDPATTDLLRSVYADGLSGASAARRHGLSPGAVRQRCSRAVKVLAAHAELLDAPGARFS
jgi:DNA-directed RNA polymerase specialized sigma24 family protein